MPNWYKESKYKYLRINIPNTDRNWVITYTGTMIKIVKE